MRDRPERERRRGRTSAAGASIVSLLALMGDGRVVMAQNAPVPPPAASPDTSEATMLALIQLLIAEGVISKDKAQALLEQAQKLAAAAAANKAASGVANPPGTPADAVRVPYVPEIVRNQIRDQVKQDVLAQAKTERWGDPGTLPAWLDRIKFTGDIRLRGRGDYFNSGNFGDFPNYNQINNGSFTRGDPNLPTRNTTHDNEQGQIRARLGLLAELGEGFSAGLRLATGNQLNPVSTNDTLSQSLGNNNFNLDRAYIRYDRPIPSLHGHVDVVAGRFENPFFSTDLLWDEDLNFDGIAATYEQTMTEKLKTFLTAGFFPLQNIALTGDNKYLYAAQLGTNWQAKPQLGIKGAFSYYGYSNITGSRGACNNQFKNDSVQPSLQGGNSLFDVSCVVDPLDPNADILQAGLAAKFDELNFTAQVDWNFHNDLHLVGTGDVVYNISYDRKQVRDRVEASGVDFNDTGEGGPLGFRVSLLVGEPELKALNDWNFSVAYKYLQGDAVVDSFTDSDFHLGGTNAKGFIVGGSYGLGKYVWLSARLLASEEIDGQKFGVDTFLLDVNARF